MVKRFSMVEARMQDNPEFGDYVLYSDYAALEAKLQAAQEREKDTKVHLLDAIKRMDRARNILTSGGLRPQCNWGMLDTTSIKQALQQHDEGGGE